MRPVTERKNSVSTPTRRRLTAEERRTALLDAALSAFSARGYHNTSLDDVAREAGVSKALIYEHFASKQELYADLIARNARELTQRVAGALSGVEVESTSKRLATGLEAFFAFVEERRDGWVVLHRDGPAGAAAAGRLRELRARLAATIAQLLAREPGEREEALAHAIVGAGEALATYWVEHPSIPAEVVASELVELVWPGLERLAGARV